MDVEGANVEVTTCVSVCIMSDDGRGAWWR